MKNKLSKRIIEFLDKFASVSPNWDGDGDSGKYTGPDPYFLLVAAEVIENNGKPEYPFSDWGSGCYRPYSSREGQVEHNTIKDAIIDVIRNYKV